MTDQELPLGRKTSYPDQYDPSLLFSIARTENRDALIRGDLPFDGVDIWNAWELTWLGPGGLPVVATARIIVPATTPGLIESKSLKLYLNSFAMTSFDDPAVVESRLTTDLAKCAGAPVSVSVNAAPARDVDSFSVLPGTCLDSLTVRPAGWEVDASILKSDALRIAEEDLHTHLLRSLCPVTGQPDIGSLAVHYRGPKIDAESLLQYVVSFRQHSDFHEACIERMFIDILSRCAPEKLSIDARYLRRGGIDINPFRSNFSGTPENRRLWRQ